VRTETVYLAIALAAVSACGRAPTAPEPVPMTHATAVAELAPVEARVPFVGVVEDARVVRLEALADARVEAVEVADGAVSLAGEVLFRLGGGRFESALATAEAAASAARETVAARSEQLERARRRESDHLAGPSEVPDARAGLAAAEREAAAVGSRVRTLAAAREVRAPFAGRLLDRRVSVGQEVTAGEELARFADATSGRVAATVIASMDRPVRAGQEVQIASESGEVETARVAGVASVASPAGAARVWVTADGLAKMQPGTAVSGWIVTERHQGIVIPTRAVVRDDADHPYVFVGPAAPFERRPVVLGIALGERIEVTSGLAAGEIVVTEGAYELLWASFSTSFTAAD
jgi:cobalt-zinc-cadmium efflux system membrane fusion protein